MSLGENISIPPLAILQMKKSEKWRAFDNEILPMPFAVMDYEIAQPIKDALLGMINNSDTGYLGKMPEVAIGLVAFAEKRWGWQVTPDQVKLCTDVGVGVIEVARLITKPGDRILINSPVYYNFYNWITEVNCLTVDVPLLEKEHSYYLDFPAIESAYASGVKVHILCNPHNPVGAVFSEDDLAQLATMAKKHDVIILADEIHAPLVYAEKCFTPFLNSSATAKEVGIAFLSATKAWNIAGLKCAQIVAQSKTTQEIVKKLPAAIHSRASLFGAVASATAWHHSVDWLDAVIKDLTQKRELLQSLVTQHLPGVHCVQPQGGYFGWLDLRAINIKDDITEHFLTHGKIAIAAGHLYGPGGAGFIRMNFATSEEIVREAVNRIERAIASA
jgi:cystathionine beta-lyase